MNELTEQIIKWTAIVFLAGFIGYFGRYLSMQLIEKFKRKKTGSKKPLSKYEYKLEKKRLKTKKK